MMQQISRLAFGVFAATAAGMSGYAAAELQPMGDEQLSETTGQAFMSVTNTNGLSGESFTRMTLGTEMDLRMSVDSIEFAKLADANATTGADLILRDWTYGSDTSAFATLAPYIEFAEVGGEMVGMRMGFLNARGEITGLMDSFTGNIGLKVDMDGTGTDIRDAQLLNNTGTATNYRATHIGIDDTTATCAATCAPLTNLDKLIVGTDAGGGQVGYTNDFFFSLQKQSVGWLSNQTSGQAITANSNVFFNIPTAMTVNMADLVSGPIGAAVSPPQYVETGVKMF